MLCIVTRCLDKGILNGWLQTEQSGQGFFLDTDTMKFSTTVLFREEMDTMKQLLLL